MNTDQPITIHLQALADLRRDLLDAERTAEPYVRAVADLNDQIDATKVALAEAMKQAGSLRTEPVAGIAVTRATRRTLSITDAQAALAYVRSRPDQDDYISVDTARYKKLAEAALKTDGEKLPGTELRETDYLTVREAV